MGSLIPSNASTCGILNFVGSEYHSTSAMKGDSVCCTRVSIVSGTRPLTTSFTRLSSC